MISTGLWDTVNGVGSPELVAATTLHEAGHNGNLWHGGPPPTWNAATRQLTFEPNCKPDYTSIMSYLFQVVGQLDDTGKQFFDYSRDANPGDHALNENALTSNFFPLLQPYRTAWFAPVVPGSLPSLLGSTPAKKYCTGMPFPSPKPAGWVDMSRVNGPLTTECNRLGQRRRAPRSSRRTSTSTAFLKTRTTDIATGRICV